MQVTVLAVNSDHVIAYSAMSPETMTHLVNYTRAEKDYVMLTRWLPDTPSTLPSSASHQVGVGAFIFDEGSRLVLSVQERNGPLKNKQVWKMPTGLVNLGEDITEAVVREVLEETGVDVEFDSVLAIRQSHGFAFGKSDLFFVVACKPVLPNGRAHVQEIPITPQESEIERCAWIPIEEFLNVEFMRSRPLYSQIMDTCAKYASGEYKGIPGAKLSAGSDRQDLLLFGHQTDSRL